jgi:hypothetical protein
LTAPDAAHGQQLARDLVVDEPGQRLVVHAREAMVKASTGWPPVRAC